MANGLSTFFPKAFERTLSSELLQALFDGEDDGNRFRISLQKGKYDWLYMIRGEYS
jgi:hypothetical protein